jgi:hypothetical protein
VTRPVQSRRAGLPKSIDRFAKSEKVMVDSFVFHVDWAVVVIVIFLLALVLVSFVYRRRDRD